MRNVDLQNALARFPGNADLEVSGTVTVAGVTVCDGSDVLVFPKGTKGHGAEATEGDEPKKRSRNKSK